MTSFKNNEKGVLIVEILVVIAIIGIALVYLLGLAAYSLKIQNLTKNYVLANNLAQEAIETVRNYRDGTDWNKTEEPEGLGVLDNGVAYHPEISGNKWTLILGEETINDFERRVVFENGLRDGNGKLVGSGGSNDPDTKKVTVTVSWEGKSVEIVTYLTNWKL